MLRKIGLLAAVCPSAVWAQDSGVQAAEDALAEIVERQGGEVDNEAPDNDIIPVRTDGANILSPTITVTADGFYTNIDDTGQPVTVIDRGEIERVQGPDLARIVTRVPGTTVVRNGSLGGFTGVSLRGASADRVLVLLDGVKVSDQAAPGGGFDWSTLSSGTIAAIDVLRGPNSVVWGSEAIGGVVNLSTRRQDGIAASLEYGSRDTLFAEGAAGIDGNRYAVGLTASHLRTDGFSSAANGTEADGFEQTALGLSGFIELTDTVEAFAILRYSDSDAEIDGFSFVPPFGLVDSDDRQETERWSGTTGLVYYGTDLTLRAAYAMSETDRDTLDGAGNSTFASEGRSDQLVLRGEYRLIGGLFAAFGAEREWTEYRTTFDDEASATITGGYVQLGWELGRLAVHVGSRVDDHSIFGTNGSYGGDVSYRFGNSDWRVRASVGEGFKAPTLFQLFSDFGNRRLVAEESTGFDVGVERGARGVGTHLAASVFRRDSQNLIDFVSCFGQTSAICIDRPFGTYDNVGRARSQGLEIEAGADLLQGLRLAGQYSYIDSEDRETGLDLARRPHHSATLFFDWELDLGLSLGADLRVVGASFDDAANSVRLGGYEVFDVRLAYDLSDRFQLFGRVENVFDADYQTAAGYAQAGRGVFAGVRLRQ